VLLISLLVCHVSGDWGDVRLSELAQHVFATGLSGSGKTTTLTVLRGEGEARE